MILRFYFLFVILVKTVSEQAVEPPIEEKEPEEVVPAKPPSPEPGSDEWTWVELPLDKVVS